MSRYRSSDNCKVYVGDLPKDVSEKELERVFREFGSLRSIWVARNPPGFAFVEFDDERDAEDAVKNLDGSHICGVRARVKPSTDKPPRQRQPMRRQFDPSDRCFKCNERGHYAYDCEKYKDGSSHRRQPRHRSYSRSRSRSYDRRRSYSQSRSGSKDRRRRSPSRSRS